MATLTPIHGCNPRLTRPTVDTGIESYEPSASAIKQHIDVLRKNFGNGATGGGGTPKAKTTATSKATPRATPKATPKKSAPLNTPKSSAKRKRVSNSSDEDEDMNDAEDDSAAEREMLKTTPSGPRSTLSRRLKSIAKTYNEDDESEDDEFATPQNNTRAATPTPAPAAAAPAVSEEEQTDFFGGGAFDGAGDDGGQMDGVVATGLVGGTLTPQGKAANGHAQANSAAKRVAKRGVEREERVDDSDVSEFEPDFM